MQDENMYVYSTEDTYPAEQSEEFEDQSHEDSVYESSYSTSDDSADEYTVENFPLTHEDFETAEEFHRFLISQCAQSGDVLHVSFKSRAQWATWNSPSDRIPSYREFARRIPLYFNWKLNRVCIEFNEGLKREKAKRCCGLHIKWYEAGRRDPTMRIFMIN
jgi:hypothetical protein